jgi:hypothetical protein
LADKILSYQETLENACDVCAELDCLLSFAQASRTYDYQRPRMVMDNVIDITGGRFVITFVHGKQTDEPAEDIHYTNRFSMLSYPTMPLL